MTKETEKHKDNYVVYHLHSDLSLLDSTTKYQDYINRAVELGQKAICFTEHGNLYNWVSKKTACDKAGIKYIHGVEIYLTEKLEPKTRDNYHTILLAKNMNGLKEINKLISVASKEDHFYFKPRISFDEFMDISDDVIKISACLASPLNAFRKEHIDMTISPFYKLLTKYDYYEVQPHINSEEQKEYNIFLYELSQKLNKPLIAGTDTHSLNKYKAECRSILQLAKGIEYTNEDDFDLTYKTYDELVSMFDNQGSLCQSVYMEAIKNTVVMADSIEDIKLDLSFKYPKVCDDDVSAIKERIKESLKDKINRGVIPKEQKETFKLNIREELRVFKKINMCGFMLFMSNLIRWCKENDIPVGFARGSCAGSCIAYILDIIDVNPVTWNTVFSRFANENRKEIGDIDIDFAPSDRDSVYNYMIDLFGEDYTDYILAIGTVSDKGTIDEIGRALSRKYPDNDKFSLQSIANVKTLFENDQDTAREKYPEIFYYFDGILNTAISQSMHPAGMVVSPVTLFDNYGELYRDGKKILQIDMESVHDVSLVKYDILGLKNVGIIKDACKLAKIKYPLSHIINWNDQDVWKDMLKSPHGIFQFEGDYAFSMLKQFMPKSIFDMSLITAALRPSGASYRDDLMVKKIHKNPSSIIDDMLKDNYGYLIYQEDTIKFLQQICGLSGSEADNVRRAIGRKQKDRLDEAMPSILEGYCNMSPQPRKIAEEEAKQFLQIIEDSASYQFGYNHSIAYCMIGYVCAYLRYYYPIEFITSYLNNANNENDIMQGLQLAETYNINIKQPMFGKSIDIYFIDYNTKSIYKGVASIKYLNSRASLELYQLSQEKEHSYFTDLLCDIQERTSLNQRQLEILIKCGYFQQYGSAQLLLGLAKEFKNGKNRITKTLKEETILKRKDAIKGLEINKEIKDDISDIDIIIFKMQNGIDYKETNIVHSNREFIVSKIKYMKTNNKARAELYQLSTGRILEVKFQSTITKGKCVNVYDYIHVDNIKRQNKWYLDNNEEDPKKKWKRYKDEDNQKEFVVYDFYIIKKHTEGK